MSERGDRFAPNRDGPTGIFVDSSALYAYFYPRDECHDDAQTFFEAVRRGDLPYRPMFTNDYVLDEVVTRLRLHATHDVAVEALDAVYEGSAFEFCEVPSAVLGTAVDQFRAYDDHGELSFTDHVIAAHADALSTDHVLTFDADFETFGLTTIPHYVA